MKAIHAAGGRLQKQQYDQRTLPAVLVSVLFSVLVAAAAARVGPPVEVQLLGTPRAATANTNFAGEIAIRTGTDAVVTDIRLSGAGWLPIRLDAPSSTSLAAGTELRVPFEARPSDPEQSLSIEFAWNGVHVSKRFDLSAAHVDRVSRPGQAVVAPDRLQQPFPGVDRSQPSPEPAAAADAAERGLIEKDDEPGGRSRSIRVRGRFIYYRDDNVVLGGDGITVKIMDEDFGVDDELGSTITNTQGYFDITVNWDQIEDDPDLYVEFQSVNSKANVRDDTWFITYKWATATQDDYTGTDLNIGTVMSGDESLFGAVHVMTDVVRTWRWYVNRGFDCSEVDVFWPADSEDNSFYTPSPWRNIHFIPGHTWFETVHSHEYTHHFEDDFGHMDDIDYCNPGGFCDDPGDCGHCVWCRENSYVTYCEGLAEFGGDVIPSSFAASYGHAAQHIDHVETINACHEDGNFHSPLLTEGYFAAVLVDIHDINADDDPQYPGYADQLAMGADAILACVHDHNTNAPLAFLLAFKADNYAQREALWETAMNCGYDIDESSPDAVTNLHPDGNHPYGEPSADNTITVHWNRALDDASGIYGYSVSWTHTPQNPGTALSVYDVLTTTSDELAPGTWYCNVRARDRVGNWSSTYAYCGPMIIREAEASDLELFHHTGWDYTLVPSASNTNGLWDCMVSPTLPGDTNGTYWNVTGRNNGESTTSATVVGQVGIDEKPLAAADYGYLDQWESFYTLNGGPLAVPAGRHVFHCVLDPYGHIPETIEWNNDWGHQFVWIPPVMSPNVVVSRPTPGFILAGWDYIHDGSTFHVNVDGLRMPDTAWWNILVSWPQDLEEFYPIALFDPATGAESGFQTSLATSFRSAGCLNAVIVNQNTVPAGDWDIGVSNWTPDDFDGGYKAVYLQGGTAIFNSNLTHAFGADVFFTLKEFYVAAGNVGSVSLVVETEPPYSPLHVQWRDEWFTYGKLIDCTEETVTDADGRAYLQFEVTETGYNSIAFWRDPVDGADPVTIRYRLEKTPPDFAPRYYAGWHSPAVPRPLDDGTVFSVPLPDTLYGDIASTYYNFTFRNDSPTPATDLDVYLYLDGQSSVGFNYANFPGYAFGAVNWSVAQTVAGGRHTFAFAVDPANTIPEINEDNNVYGEQYCWSPYPLAAGQYRAFVPAPPERSGGWDQVRSGEPLWYNNHGYRLTSPATWWTGCAVMPGDTTNVDLRLHEPLVGAKNGYTASLVYSGWSRAKSDYVLINHNIVPHDEVDVGVLRIAGAQTYTLHYATEEYLGANPNGVFGAYTLGAMRTLSMHEMYLAPGTWSFELRHLGGSVDWGLCLHPCNQPYVAKSQTVPGGAAWENGLGQNESFIVELADAGYYLLAVWKAHSHNLLQTGTYELAITNQVVAVDDGGVPAATALTSVFPNPFNPCATLAFDLADAGSMDLAIYDLKGTRVRTLVRETRPAGRHTVIWDGCGDRGQPLASGIYLVRFHCGEVRQLRKVTLVK